MVKSLKDAIKELKETNGEAFVEIMQQFKVDQRKRMNSKSVSSSSCGVFEEQLGGLPRALLGSFYEDMPVLLTACDNEELFLCLLESLAIFLNELIEREKSSNLDKDKIFVLAQGLHDQLLQLAGPEDQVLETQEAIAILCETCWKKNFNQSAHTLVTQLLPYLIVRSYESPPNSAFNSKRHPIRRLYAIKDALGLLDFDDESSGLLKDILLRCFIQPLFLRSPDAIGFLSFLFELHLPFVDEINETIRNQIPNQRKSILKKFGQIYFKAWVTASKESSHHDEFRVKIEQECIQRFLQDAVHANSLSMFNAIHQVLEIFFDNKKHTGVDEMLYRLSGPILWRSVCAPNDSVRHQAAVLLFDNFPMRDPNFNHEAMDRMLQKQFDTFEELLNDSHPAVRIAAIQGVAKILSIYWELLPMETIRCFLSKLIAELVHDMSSAGVRVAVFEAIQLILDNHQSHSILKPLLPSLSPLIHDKNEKVRAEFAFLLVRIKSIRNLHFYDVVSVDELNERLVLDQNSKLVRKQLVELFLNSYFPQNVNGSSQVARCLAFIKKKPEAALVFYSHVAEYASVGSVCKLAALLTRCALNFTSGINTTTTSKKKTSHQKKSKEPESESEESDEKEEEEFNIVGQIVVLQVIGNLLKSVYDQVMYDARYSECKKFLSEHLSAESIRRLLFSYSTTPSKQKSISNNNNNNNRDNSSSSGNDEDEKEEAPTNRTNAFYPEALGALWRVIGFLGDICEGNLLENLVENLMEMDEGSSQRQLHAMVDCLTKWHQLPFLIAKIKGYLHEWQENGFQKPSGIITSSISKTKQRQNKKQKQLSFCLHPIVALTAVDRIVQSYADNQKDDHDDTGVNGMKSLESLFDTLHECIESLVELSPNQLFSLCKSDSFGILRLVQVYSKLSIMLQSAQVSIRTSKLLKQSKKRLPLEKDLLAIQPSSFFHIPQTLVPLMEWMITILEHLHLQVNKQNESKKKKRRRRDDDGLSTEERSTEERLLCRFQNIFSSLLLLIQECIVLTLQNRQLDATSEDMQLIGEIVQCLRVVLAKKDFFDRSVFFQCCQMFYLLEKCPMEQQQQQHVETINKSTLDTWHQELGIALENAYENNQEDAKDLWKMVSSAVDH